MRIAFAAPLLLAVSAQAAPFTATEMMKLKRWPIPRLSPDGKWVAYQSTDVDLAAGTRNSDIWIVPASAGGAPRRLTDHPQVGHAGRAGAPTASGIAFVSTRDGASQVYVVDARGRRGAQGDVPVHRGRRRPLDRRRDAARDVATSSRTAGARTTSCNKKKAWTRRASRRPRASTTACSTGTGTPGTTAGARHLFVVPLDGGPARDLTPGDARRAARSTSAGPTTTRSRPTARRSASRATTTRSEAIVHQRRALRRAARAAATPMKIADAPGYDGAPRYSPDGTAHRVPRPAARGLRGRPLAAHGLRPRTRRHPRA